jgi:hypothetical protein
MTHKLNCFVKNDAKGLDEDCPEGQTCHGGTTCNLIDLLVKAEVPDGPTLKPTMPPRDDLSNSQFCGESWDLADAACSLGENISLESENVYNARLLTDVDSMFDPITSTFKKQHIARTVIVPKARSATVEQVVMHLI